MAFDAFNVRDPGIGDLPSMQDMLLGAVDTAATMGTAMVAEPVAGLVGLMARDPGAIRHVQDAMTWAPRTNEGRKNIERIQGMVDSVVNSVGLEHAPGYWRERVVPALQEQFGTAAGAALAAAGLAAISAIGSRGKVARGTPGAPRQQIGAIGDLPPKGIPNLRGMDADEAIRIASKEPHLIKQTPTDDRGLYVGGPRDIKTRRGLRNMRGAVDEQIARGAEGADWYDRYRAFTDEVTGGDPRDATWMSNIEGQYSAGVSPESELAFALKDTNSAIASGGFPTKAARPAQQAASIRAIQANDPAMFQLGKKTGEYAHKINPAVHHRPTSTGVNDFRQARAYKYTQKSGDKQSEGLGEAQHRFLDYETTLAVKRAREKRLAGRDDWTGEQAQAAPWVAQKADDLFERNQKRYMKEAEKLSKNGRNDPVAEIAWNLAFEDASKTIADFADKHTAFGTFEAQPYHRAGHLQGLQNASMREKADYLQAAPWELPDGRDALYAGMRLDDTGYAVRTRRSQDMQGVYEPKGGDIEFNPGGVARPLVAFDAGKAKSVPDADRSILDAAENMRAYLDVQGGGAWHKVWVGGQPGLSNSVVLKRAPGAATADEIRALRRIGDEYGLPDVIDTGEGFTLTNFMGEPEMSKKRFDQMMDEVKDLIPRAEGHRAKVDSNYLDFEDEWTLGQGSGAATRKLLSRIDALPEGTQRALDNNPYIPAKALERVARDRQAQARYGVGREDVEKARKIIGEGPGWVSRLRSAVDRGELLPAVGLLMLYPASRDEQSQQF